MSLHEQAKKKDLNNKHTNFQALDKELLFLEILEARNRFCDDDTKNEYFPKMCDPFSKGAYCRRIKKKKNFQLL